MVRIGQEVERGASVRGGVGREVNAGLVAAVIDAASEHFRDPEVRQSFAGIRTLAEEFLDLIVSGLARDVLTWDLGVCRR